MTATPAKYMVKATIASLCCNIVLVLIKSVALVVVNSLAIAMDLGISVAGLLVSVILFFSVRLASRPADLFHNYGYGKVEHVCEAIEGIILIGIAIALSSQAIVNIFHPEKIMMPWVGLSASLTNTMINFGGALYIFRMAEKSSSPAIHAEGVHYRLEGFISGMIACSFLLSMYLRGRGLAALSHYIDPATAVLVSLIVIIPSFKLARRSFFKLLDSSVEEGSQMEILRQLNMHLERFCEFRDLKTRISGRNKFVELKLVLPGELSLEESHRIAAAIEEDIRKAVPNCEVNIHLHPCDRDCRFVRRNITCPYAPGRAV